MDFNIRAAGCMMVVLLVLAFRLGGTLRRRNETQKPRRLATEFL
jgi:hypothetical protein